MCLGIPMRVVSIEGFTARCEARGVEREVTLFMLQDEPVTARGLPRRLEAGATAKLEVARLNSGKLQPILNTLKTLKELGVWFELINLVVPTYTDDLGTIRRMCAWIAKELGPDQPLHFSRFHPQHKLAYLAPTPVQTLVKARDGARNEGLRYVYIGNVPGLKGAETTWCPGCKKAVVERDIFSVTALNLADGKCRSCGTRIAGVWLEKILGGSAFTPSTFLGMIWLRPTLASTRSRAITRSSAGMALSTSGHYLAQLLLR